MITSVDHIHIHAADPRATIRFYESCLGAEHLGSIPSGEGGENHRLLEPVRQYALARLRDAGAQVHAEARRTGSIRYAYVTVPDGVVIELVELHLPPHLAPLMPVLGAVNRAIHLTRRTLAKRLFK